MNEQTLHVTPELGEDIACYRFSGIIDAYSKQILSSLAQTPPSPSQVVLDFSEIQRINSMGLALLLKMLNVWEGQGKSVRVVNLNRMAAILFKITGLGRFLEGGGEAGRGPSVDTGAPAPQPRTSPASIQGKLRMFAHLQTSQQLNGWFLFNTYLQRQLHRSIQFQAQTLADRNDSQQPPEAELVFAGPFEACRLIRGQGFSVVAKPCGETDEVVILAHAEDTRPLESVTGAKVAVASEHSFTYLLGRFLCDEKGLDSDNFTFHQTGNDIKAVQFLIRRKVDWVIMSRKTFEGLSSLSRRQLKVMDQSQTELTAHLFCAAPYLDESTREGLKSALLGMKDDDRGCQLFQDLEIEGWTAPEPAEVEMLLKVYQSYAE